MPWKRELARHNTPKLCIPALQPPHAHFLPVSLPISLLTLFQTTAHIFWQPNSGKMTLLIAILTFFSTTSSSEWPQQSLSSMSGKGVRTETARWTRNTNAGWESHDGGFKMEFIVSAVSDCVYVFVIIYTGSRKNKATRTKFKPKMKRSNVQLDFEFWAHTSIACEASVSVRVLYLFRCSSAWTFAPVPKYAR